MTPQHFQTQMNRLAETFSTAAYKRERTQLIWQEVQDMPEKAFTQLVSRMIAESRQAPLVADFTEAARNERRKQHEARKALRVIGPEDLAPRASCGVCKDTGTVLARAKDRTELGHGLWAFKCDCSAGKYDPRAYPAWLDHLNHMERI